MIVQTNTIKQCIACDKSIRGRTDKRFCNDYCRNSYNNQLKAPSNNLVRNINHTLSKNRRILESLIVENEEMSKVKKERLIQQGYRFKYHTHQYINPKGSIYYYCYDYGYLYLEKDWCLIIRAEKE